MFPTRYDIDCRDYAGRLFDRISLGTALSSKSASYHHATFEYCQLKIRVASQDQRDLIWLREFLRPSFREKREGSSDWNVRVLSDWEKHKDLLSRGAHDSEKYLDCFLLDSRMVRLPLWKSGTNEKIVFDQAFKVFYGVRRKENEAVILAPTNRPWQRRIPLMRVVRELAMNHSVESGGITIHGSALRVDGTGILIAGPKGAGKTTLLIHMLRQTSAEYISNDRVVVFVRNGRPVMQGMPTIVTANESTLKMFGSLEERLTSSFYNPCLSLKESRSRLLGTISLDDKGQYNLSPAQFREFLDVGATRKSKLEVLLFPRITNGNGGIRLKPLTFGKAAQRLRSSFFRAHSPCKISNVFTSSLTESSETEKELEKFSDLIIKVVRCYDCFLGKKAYSGPDLTESLTAGGVCL